MTTAMSSRERMLCAIGGGRPDHVPLAFMIFSALRQRCASPFEFFERQVALGLDTVVELSLLNADEMADCGDAYGPPVRFGQLVEAVPRCAPNCLVGVQAVVRVDAEGSGDLCRFEAVRVARFGGERAADRVLADGYVGLVAVCGHDAASPRR